MKRGTYILNAKDLCLLPYIDKLAAAGVTSLKIEGRAKSAYYVAAVTNAYRIAVDDFYARPEGWQLPGWLSDEVRKVSHRDYSAGFLFGRPEAGQRYEQNGYIRLTDVAAVVANGWRMAGSTAPRKTAFSTATPSNCWNRGNSRFPLPSPGFKTATGSRFPIPGIRRWLFPSPSRCCPIRRRRGA